MTFLVNSILQNRRQELLEMNIFVKIEKCKNGHFSGNYWAIFGLIWPQLGSIWPQFAQFGSIWPQFGLNLAQFGSI